MRNFNFDLQGLRKSFSRILVGMTFLFFTALVAEAGEGPVSAPQTSMSLTASARVTPSFMTSILSYDELMQLSVAKRQAYLDGLKALLTELSKSNGANRFELFADREAFEHLNSKIAWLELLLPKAWADVFEEFGPNLVCPRGIYRFKIMLQVPNAEGGGSRRVERYICGFQPAVFALAISCREADHVRINTGERNTQVCMTNNSFGRLPEDYRAALRANPPAGVVTPRPAPPPVVAPLPPAPVAPPVPGPLAVPPAPPPPPTVQRCEPPPERASCPTDAETLRNNRADFYRSGSALCVFAGSISEYQGQMPSARRCSPVRRFCLQSATCRTPDGQRMRADYECRDQKEVLCNPLIFGVKKDSAEPFCVSARSNATAACNAASTSETRQLDFLNDDRNVGIKDAWDAFAGRFNRLCHSDDAGANASANFFCNECHIMRRRLFDMRAAALGAGACGDAMTNDARRNPAAPNRGAAPRIDVEASRRSQ